MGDTTHLLERPAAAAAPARPRRRRLLLVAAAALALAAGAAWLRQREAPAAPRYVTVAVQRGPVAPAVLASGTVNPVTTIQVGSYVSGVIQEIRCDFNTEVRAGQLCARIDPRPYLSAVEQARAALMVAQAQLAKDRAAHDNARRIEARNAALSGRGFIAREAVDAAHSVALQAAAQVALSEAEVAQRRAQWRSARINLGYTDIVSPVRGTVVSRNVTQGQTVAASFQTPTLFLIATDLSRMQVDASVSESDVGRIAVGNPVVFTVSAYPGRDMRGRVRQVRQAPQAVQNVVTYDAVVDAPNPDLALKPGMTASVRIETRRVEHALRVPGQALRFRPRAAGSEDKGAAPGPRVWVLDGGRPRAVAVRPGLDDDAWVEIAGGALREGEAVIVAERGGEERRAPAAPPGMFPGR